MSWDLPRIGGKEFCFAHQSIGDVTLVTNPTWA